MKETNDGPFGLKRIVTDGGTTFFRNTNGIFDETGKRVMVSMAELRRFEQNEKAKRKNHDEDQAGETGGRSSGEHSSSA